MEIINRLKDYSAGHGIRFTLQRSAEKASQIVFGTYDRHRRKDFPDGEELARQRENQPAAGLISVIVPVYNTDPRMLRELLDSLTAQTYAEWEAVLYDGGSTREETREILAGAEKKDARFRVIRAEENLGISGNTDRAATFAKGNYFALCDHDDLLSPEALWRTAEVIAGESPDLIYSDEDLMTENGTRHMDPHYKPDYCPENLFGDNYICHLAVLKKDLWEKVGGLRPGYDGSQDHDLFLRCAGETDRITHIPRTLYSWRKVRKSASHTNLCRCLDASCRAAEDQAERMGRKLTAIPVNREIRLWWDVPTEASVELLIFGGDEESCRMAYANFSDTTPWRKLSATFVVTDAENLYGALNEAAAASEADYLLILSAGVRVMNRHFLRELLMYACMPGVAGVTPVMTDARNRITHGGFAVGFPGFARCVYEGTHVTAGGWYQVMNKVHNVSAVSVCCRLVRRETFLPFDPSFVSGLGAVEQCLRQRDAGGRFVYTPYARAWCEDRDWLLCGKDRDEADLKRIRDLRGNELNDPCYGTRFSRKNADYRLK